MGEERDRDTLVEMREMRAEFRNMLSEFSSLKSIVSAALGEKVPDRLLRLEVILQAQEKESERNIRRINNMVTWGITIVLGLLALIATVAYKVH